MNDWKKETGIYDSIGKPIAPNEGYTSVPPTDSYDERHAIAYKRIVRTDKKGNPIIDLWHPIEKRIIGQLEERE